MSNIGFPLTEFTIEGVIRDGLGELRANPSRVDDLFNRFKEAQFVNQFGQNQIDRLKTYINNKQIKIVHAYAFQPSVMPCYSIQIVSTSENEEDQQLGNVLGISTDPANPNVIVSNVTPTAYDTTTGQLTIDPGVDLSAVCPNLVFVDGDGTEFTIQSGISNVSGKKFINIGTGKEPKLNEAGEIVSSIDFTATNREMIRLREVVRLGVHAKDDVHLAKYLYYILYYIIKSRQRSLITRGIHLDQGVVNVFDRLDEFEGENVFSRFYDMHCLTEFNWDQDQVAAADCFELDLKVPDPDPDSSGTRKV